MPLAPYGLSCNSASQRAGGYVGTGTKVCHVTGLGPAKGMRAQSLKPSGGRLRLSRMLTSRSVHVHSLGTPFSGFQRSGPGLLTQGVVISCLGCAELRCAQVLQALHKAPSQLLSKAVMLQLVCSCVGHPEPLHCCVSPATAQHNALSCPCKGCWPGTSWRTFVGLVARLCSADCWQCAVPGCGGITQGCEMSD